MVNSLAKPIDQHQLRHSYLPAVDQAGVPGRAEAHGFHQRRHSHGDGRYGHADADAPEHHDSGPARGPDRTVPEKAGPPKKCDRSGY
jgi:hypothetical protein